MGADIWTAIIAGATFMVMFATTMISGGIWISGKFAKIEEKILAVLRAHEEKDERRFEHVYEIMARNDLNIPRDARRNVKS